MPETANALHGHQISGNRSCITKSIEGGNPRAHKWCSGGGRQIFGQGGDCFRRHNHVVCVSAVKVDCCDFLVAAKHEISMAAEFACEAVSTMPSYADALSGLPVGNSGSNGVDAAGNFMA